MNYEIMEDLTPNSVNYIWFKTHRNFTIFLSVIVLLTLLTPPIHIKLFDIMLITLLYSSLAEYSIFIKKFQDE